MKREQIPYQHEYERQPVPILEDGAVASIGISEGKLIPLVIIDTSKRLDITELARIHETLPPGDVTVQWGDLDERDGKLNLILRFVRPSEVLLIIEFELPCRGILVDQIVNTKGLYIQPGKVGDRLSTTMVTPRILAEIPDTGFKKTWDDTFLKVMIKDFRNKGLNRHDAKRAAKQFIDEWRNFGRLRMRR